MTHGTNHDHLGPVHTATFYPIIRSWLDLVLSAARWTLSTLDTARICSPLLVPLANATAHSASTWLNAQQHRLTLLHLVSVL